jgi:hypothetical protein
VFNPLALVRDRSQALVDYKEAEIVNGRLAMVAMLGYGAQARVVRGEGMCGGRASKQEGGGGVSPVSGPRRTVGLQKVLRINK